MSLQYNAMLCHLGQEKRCGFVGLQAPWKHQNGPQGCDSSQEAIAIAPRRTSRSHVPQLKKLE
jgi:hypothetical protein